MTRADITPAAIEHSTMHVVLVRPQIATNTGNIIRLCANVGAHLHLVAPLGFSLDESSVKRAGLDYHELTTTSVHPSLDDAIAATRSTGDDELADVGGSNAGAAAGAVWAFTGRATRIYGDVRYGPGDVFVFGTERHGLADADLSGFDEAHRLRIPMRPDNRSLNLANAVAVVAYEAWRQLRFAGAAGPGVVADSDGNTTAESVALGSGGYGSRNPDRQHPDRQHPDRQHPDR